MVLSSPPSTMCDSWHHSPRTGRNGEHSKIDIEEEYKSTLRTKSYEDILKEFQKKLKTTTRSTAEVGEGDEEEKSLVPDHVRLAGNFTGQDLEHLLPAGDQAPLHGLLRDYIESGAKAWDFCYALLKSIKRARANLRVLQRVVRTHQCPRRDDTKEHCRRMFLDFKRIALLDNPFSEPGLVSSPATKGVYAPLIPRLRSLQRKVARHAGFLGFCFKATGMALVPCGAARSAERRRRMQAQLGARLEAAARGAYALDREFHTVGRMLARVSDEVEHDRDVLKAFLQNQPGRYPWREVVRRLQKEDGWLLEQLRELEEHAYLCLLTIRRARDPLVQELTSLADS